MHARARTDVQDVVGRTDRVLVMLDHDHGVTEIAQAGEGAQEALVVALVQPDRRLVEYVHHSHEARTDLARQPDALRLATRQRVGLAIEREVVEAHVVEEREALADLLDDLDGDLAAPTRELQALEEAEGMVDGRVRSAGNRALGDEHVPVPTG